MARTTEVKRGEAVHTQRVNYRCDALGRAAAIELPGHDPIQLFWDATGRIDREVLNGRLKRYREFDRAGYLTEQKVFSGEGVLFKQEYEYDKAGNLTRKTDSLFGRDQFCYDPVGRLITHFDPEGEVSRYLHDPAGDLLQTQVSGEGEAWRRTGEYDSVRYTFDRVGNLIERTAPQGAAGFLWDANGRLIGSISNGKKTTYQYDPLESARRRRAL